jgi:hypothetical protein
VADCVAAQITHEQAVERGTHEKQARAWKHWGEYIESIRIKNDDYLENFTREQRRTIIGAFALALQEARFSKPNYERLAAGTVSSTVQYVCTSFREWGYPNPSLDEDGRPAFILQQEFQAFKNTDPAKRHQAAIPLSIISEINKRQGTELAKATAELANLGIFFAMQSCKYLKVPQADQRRTEIIRLRNVRFFQGNKQLNHDHPDLEYAECVSITFERQKKDKKMDTVLLMASEDILLCPVRVAASIVKRIRSYLGTTQNSPISTVLNGGIIEHVTSAQMINVLRDAVDAIGEVNWELKKKMLERTQLDRVRQWLCISESARFS